MAFIGEELQRLLQTLSKLPGLGTRSAKRLALYLLKNRETALEALIEHLNIVHQTYCPCRVCGYWDARDPCFFCTSAQREEDVLCVVEETSDVWVLEKAAIFKGRYHILGGLLSAAHSHSLEHFPLEGLLDRLHGGVKEIIVALNSTLEAQTTLYYLVAELREHAPHIKVSRLARGIPSGGELDYLDSSTLSSAFLERKPVGEEPASQVMSPLYERCPVFSPVSSDPPQDVL